MDLDSFIIEIKKHEEIYDSSHVNYKDNELRQNIFQEIGSMFDLTGM